VKSLLKKAGPALAKEILKAQGFSCAPIGVVCWREGSYDPPRWDKGVVETGSERAFRWWRVLGQRRMPHQFGNSNAWKLVIFCQVTGPEVIGRWGKTKVWDYVGRHGDAPMFVSDGFVNTGSNAPRAGNCGATNYGG
jgi:hypothetical protein